MFNPFKRKSEEEKLQDKYKKLLAEAHSLSQHDRRASDQKTAEAEQVRLQIEALQAKKD